MTPGTSMPLAPDPWKINGRSMEDPWKIHGLTLDPWNLHAPRPLLAHGFPATLPRCCLDLCLDSPRPPLRTRFGRTGIGPFSGRCRGNRGGLYQSRPVSWWTGPFSGRCLVNGGGLYQTRGVAGECNPSPGDPGEHSRQTQDWTAKQDPISPQALLQNKLARLAAARQKRTQDQTHTATATGQGTKG